MLVVFQVKSVSDLISKYIKCRLSLSNKDLEIEQFSLLNDVNHQDCWLLCAPFQALCED